MNTSTYTLGSVIQEQMSIIQISKNPFTNLAFDYPVTTNGVSSLLFIL